MTLHEIDSMIQRAEFATLGFLDGEGNPSMRRVFSTWHRGIGSHLISTNTSSAHVQALQRDNRACLYFHDDKGFTGLCLTGRVTLHFDHEHRAMLWADGCEIYYPKGVDDEDYCVLEFRADRGRWYGSLGKGDISAEALAAYDQGAEYADYGRK